MTTWSLALRDIPCPDYVHTVIVPLDAHGSTDPAAWARRLFSLPRTPFSIREVADDEALVAADDSRLAFRCAIAVDEDTRMLRVTTTVRVHDARGRLSVLPVRLTHPLVMRSRLRAAARSWRASV